MRVNAAQTAKPAFAGARAFKIGHFDLLRVADHHVFDVTFAVEQNPDLPVDLVRDFRKLSRQFRRNDLARSDAPRKELFNAAQLILFESVGVSENVANRKILRKFSQV
jgi:hypothetical protein